MEQRDSCHRWGILSLFHRAAGTCQFTSCTIKHDRLILHCQLFIRPDQPAQTIHSFCCCGHCGQHPVFRHLSRQPERRRFPVDLRNAGPDPHIPAPEKRRKAVYFEHIADLLDAWLCHFRQHSDFFGKYFYSCNPSPCFYPCFFAGLHGSKVETTIKTKISCNKGGIQDINEQPKSKRNHAFFWC